MPTFNALKISHIRKETDDTVSIAFTVPEELQDQYRFIQGQYLTLKTLIGGEDIRRSYSICSGLFDNELRVAIKKIKGGLFSQFANQILSEGDKIDVMTPMGNFFTPLDVDHEKHYVGFAAGSGITPLMAIIKTILVFEPKSSFTLVYGNRTRKSIIFRDDLLALKNLHMDRFNLINILSREEVDNPLFTGRINGEKASEIMDSLIPASGADEVYLCGPEEMINDVKNSLLGKNIAKEKIHFELFTSPSVGKETAKSREEASGTDSAKDSQITVIMDGAEMSFELGASGDSILDAALAQGGDLPFACKGGVCCTCRAKLIKGKVTMTANYSLEEDEVEAGFILTCQSHPLSEKIIIDFDQR